MGVMASKESIPVFTKIPVSIASAPTVLTCVLAAVPSISMMSLRQARGSTCDVQVRDEYRTDWDAGRGGYGNIVKQELAKRQEAISANMGMYEQGQEAEAGEGDIAMRERRRGSDDDD